ncbi:nesprin-4 isoform X6 [Peromyscus maniculatus bairdii]|uniref:nesprin-4 isoform X6 n=1 Tax=Peromyscus maniculatus bairdii TaxID=230844 RepID=UPI003FD4DA2C
MALAPSLGHGFPSEPLSQPLGAPREPDITGCTIGPVPGEETSRSEQARASLGPPEHITGELKDTEPATGPPGLPLASSHEHQDGGKRCEHAISGLEVLETEQDSLRLCLLGLSFQLQDLEQGLGSWTLAHSRIVQLQALQAELRGAAERVDALLAFGEGLAERSEPRLWASLERVLRALGTHRDTIFQRLWQLQTQLISYSLVLEKANLLDRDLEAEGDSDGPAPGGIWGPWAPGPAHVGAQPPETLSSSPSKASPEASGVASFHSAAGRCLPSGQEEASLSQSTGCDAGGGSWAPPCFCTQAAPDPLLSPSLLPSAGCHVVAALVRGPLLCSCPTGQDALPGAQLRQWTPSNLSPQPRHVY